MHLHLKRCLISVLQLEKILKLERLFSELLLTGLMQKIMDSIVLLQAELLQKGCQVHWQRSCQRVADRVATSSELSDHSVERVDEDNN